MSAAYHAYVLLVAGCLGLLIGSFLNVVIWRVPRAESVVHPPSACPACHARIQWFDNLPVASWIALRGRCRRCQERISARYPLVEAATGILFVAVVLKLVVLDFEPWAAPAYLYLAGIAVALALIDVDVHRLPDAIVLPAYPVSAVLLTLASWGTGDWTALRNAAIGGAALFAFYFALLMVKEGAMGFGDVKLAGVLGAYLAWLGWPTLLTGTFAAFLLGGTYAIGLMVLGRAGRSTGIPFGPWMLLGAAVGIAVGQQAWDAYLQLIV